MKQAAMAGALLGLLALAVAGCGGKSASKSSSGGGGGGQTVDKDLEPGDSAKVTVTIPKSGAISFYCKYHKSMGMAGALEASGSGGMTGTGGTTTIGTTTSKGYGY